jgi:hypothetical protein
MKFEKQEEKSQVKQTAEPPAVPVNRQPQGESSQMNREQMVKPSKPSENLQLLANDKERAMVMKAVGTISNGIAARVDSPNHLAWMYFVNFEDGREEMLLLPTADNTEKIARNFDRLPKRLQTKIEKKTPIDQRQASKFLCDWIESSWDGKKQPPLPFKTERTTDKEIEDDRIE